MKDLWHWVKQLEGELRFRGSAYPEGLRSFPGILSGQGFFPGGDGLWRNDPSSIDCPPFPVNGIMVLGNDFGCYDNPKPRSPGFIQCLQLGYEDPPTWKIKATLRQAGIPSNQCFFTNAYLGLRTGTESKGQSPGTSNNEFKAICREFFAYQIATQRPRLIICLGQEPRRLVAPVMLDIKHAWNRALSFAQLDQQCEQIIRGSIQIGDKLFSPVMVVIAHPSYAWSTYAQSPRTFLGGHGEAAEIALLAAAWQRANETIRV